MNDFVFKALFPSALTGKPSDFAGLYALALFCAVLWPRQRTLVGIGVVAAFGLAIAAPLAFAATSVPPTYLTRGVAAVNDAGAGELQGAFHEVAERHGLECRRCDYQAAEQALLSELESALRVAFPAARIRVNREPGWRGSFD